MWFMEESLNNKGIFLWIRKPTGAIVIWISRQNFPWDLPKAFDTISDDTQLARSKMN